MPERQPRYAHDCSKCIYLGQATDPDDGDVCDLYFCDRHRPTVIARWSNYPHHYHSGLRLAELIPILRVAAEMAKQKGLIT